MTTSIDAKLRYKRHSDAMESRLRNETVILHLQSGIYFGLDAVGTIVWQCLEAGETPEGISAKVRQAYTDAPASVESDVCAFMEQLLTNKLIETA